MAYNINLHSTQEFSSSATNAFRTQPWTFTPDTGEYLDFVIGSTTPAPINIATIIHNYIASTPGYESYRVFSSITTGNDGDFIEPIMVLSGEIATAQPNGYVLTENNLEVTNTLTLQNFQLIQAGNYSLKITFLIQATDANSVIHNIDSVSWEILLRVTGSAWDGVLTAPENMIFEHVINEALPAAQDLSITATGAFWLQTPSNFNLTGGNLVVDTNVDGIKTYIGTDSQTASIALTSYFNTLPVGVYTDVLFGYNSVINLYAPSTLFVFLYADYNVSISTNVLEFLAIKNVEEATAQNITIDGPGIPTIDAPAWLETEFVLEASGKHVSVKPIHSDNFSTGTYTGVITITINSVDYIIDVQHQVYENVMIGASSEKINFTDDYNTISRFFENSNFQLNLELSIRYFNYRFNGSNNAALIYMLGFFNNRSKFFIGKSLKNMMKELLDVKTVLLDTFSNQLPADNTAFIRNYYNPAEVDVSAKFLHKSDTGLNYEKNFNNLKYLKGRKPNTPFPNSYILNYYREPVRVTPNSVCLFNFYKNQTHQLRVYKNNELFKTINHAPGNKRIFAYKHDFSNTQPGDVIEIRLYKNIAGTVNQQWYEDSNNYIKQEYVVFPEGEQSNHILWEDEYGVLDCLEFTGEFKYPLNYKNKTIDNYTDFLEYITKVDVKKEQTLFINTGFHLKQNTKRIDSLLSSKRAWLVAKDTSKPIALVPVVSKYANTDSTEEVYQLTIEFNINFNNEFEIST